MMKNILKTFARNTVFANIILLLIFLAGGMATDFMIKENFPEFSLDMILISVAYPGADPEEVEEGVNRKIEEAVEGIEGIKLYTTNAYENLGTTLIEVREDFDVEDVLDDVKTNVDAISSFPVDSERPVIRELMLRDPVVILYLSGDMSERRIKEWSERLKDDMQALSGVSQVEVFGARDYEISIEVSEERLRQYNLSFDQVARAVRQSNLNLAGGTIRTTGEEIRLRTMGRKYTGRELASIVVLARPDGTLVTLDRIAHIRDGFTQDPIQATINGERSLMVIVNKTPEEDALHISETINAYVADKKGMLPPAVNLTVLYDNTEMLRDRINLLVKNGFIGLIIVLFLLWAFLNVRLSFWGGMGIPVSLSGALALLWAMGGTINMISLFGLIMVLGIVVDDAIVVGESIFVHRKTGKHPLQAAVDGVVEVGMPVFAAVITTIVAFVPLMFVGGIMGKFIAVMPVVVIASLAVSLVECIFLLPAHLSHLPDLNVKPKRVSPMRAVNNLTRNGMEWFVDHIYVPFLSKALYWRYVSLATALAVLLITIGVLKGGFLKFEVFPEVDGFVITSTVEYPEGTPASVTQAAVDRMEAALVRLAERTPTASGEPMITHRLAIVGATLGQVPDSGPNKGAVQGILLESEKRGVHTKDLLVEWEKEVGALPGVKSLTFSGMAAGPPGDPIEVWLQGHDMDRILEASDRLKERLRTFDGVYQVRSDFAAGQKELRLTLKPQARALGITVQDLASQVYSGYFGNEALRLQRGRDDIRVRVRYTEDERSRVSDFMNMRIRTPSGREVPLVSVAELKPAEGYSTITRTNGMRRVAVSAGVDTNKANANEIFAELSARFFPQLERDFPGVRISLQGEQKKMRESFSSLQIGYPLAILMIYIIVASMFRSYIQPFVILVTVPFGIIGAVFGHMIYGMDLSIMSLFGMVALSGVVVNDAIVLIERINENIAQGMPFFEAILQGGKRRFRAIFLTTVSTVGGLMPLILETNLQAKFLIPMALSIAAGVTFATVLTLVLIPSLLAIVNDMRLFVYKLRHGHWPKRVAVEPARNRHDDL